MRRCSHRFSGMDADRFDSRTRLNLLDLKGSAYETLPIELGGC